MLCGGRGQAWAWGVALLLTWARAATPSPAVDNEAAGRAWDEVLRNVSHLSSGSLGTSCAAQPFYRIAVEMERFETTRQKVDLMVRVLRNLTSQATVEVLVGSLLDSEGEKVRGVRVIYTPPHGHSPALTFSSRPPSPFTTTTTTTSITPLVNTTDVKMQWVKEQPWFWGEGPYGAPHTKERFQGGGGEGALGLWTFPYFVCEGRRWVVSYTAPLRPSTSPVLSFPSSSFPSSSSSSFSRSSQGTKNWDMELVSVDVDLSSFDINQCDLEDGEEEEEEEEEDQQEDGEEVREARGQLSFFRGSHKCDRETSKCVFRSGHGWVRGGYICRCLHGFYPQNTTFNGTMVEVAWEGKLAHNNPIYDQLYTCRPCPKHCQNCTREEPCDAPYNWPFRIALLSISSLCIVFTFVLMALVYHYRSVKVFRLASPTFLCICLIGCTIMYLEMAAIFPVLDTYSCVATKWTRHLGFCITFSSLLMKTWRVSLTYRVTSAHKIKLTDKQLLQWLTPILLIMLVYLGAWSLSATPSAEVMDDDRNLKYKQCIYDWWDHSLAMGEVLFLMWGVKVCFSVRKAESFFDEAKYISWAVYNIAVVNIVMVAFHLLIFPKAGPDIKYLFGFLRTQFSTSTTVLLIFGPKFYRIVQGTGDQYDNRARAKGVTASFSLNGLGVMNDEPADLSQENEELKEEIQKLAAQMEFMKIVHMEMNNRHLKPKPSGYFSDKNPAMAGPTSPSGPRSDTTTQENPPAKLSSPANEGAADRV
ncbi:probable G-protein coupled receptor CG31760 [Eriocheir sinensis]|uniref:probable G-protein coupled receptor CG31760 n=1 Tax=Eriocheir sinensis TaxID=95602 RepID=UPI0021C82AA0|nr:probable G-protein coupled receptor CG31760 [Eriocheir sinensis]XP_050691308.1 probable G-protein coupled receptor CG31760 [Eriocheir sinensis]XP_050691309.1 probable G-protein coupled receptor CG31760 [Eriocheir sinensis]XP_050691310.1 probable G-protein coupled receptor CG31760 [Eriocheir sinensis]XP_050691311.1 probable G-protein coupled receptor CG31760 [Eriocheir sinensis]XP_050691312.1 probable G-protein coupled receptor CG31760 [Eriocheir sinensis]XP_050691313.1 probable G-protein c